MVIYPFLLFCLGTIWLVWTIGFLNRTKAWLSANLRKVIPVLALISGLSLMIYWIIIRLCFNLEFIYLSFVYIFYFVNFIILDLYFSLNTKWKNKAQYYIKKIYYGLRTAYVCAVLAIAAITHSFIISGFFTIDSINSSFLKNGNLYNFDSYDLASGNTDKISFRDAELIFQNTSEDINIYKEYIFFKKLVCKYKYPHSLKNLRVPYYFSKDTLIITSYTELPLNHFKGIKGIKDSLLQNAILLTSNSIRTLIISFHTYGTPDQDGNLFTKTDTTNICSIK